ncbi:hypothetical protein CSUI_004290, partial [Cystoisospora suis]
MASIVSDGLSPNGVKRKNTSSLSFFEAGGTLLLLSPFQKEVMKDGQEEMRDDKKRKKKKKRVIRCGVLCSSVEGSEKSEFFAVVDVLVVDAFSFIFSLKLEVPRRSFPYIQSSPTHTSPSYIFHTVHIQLQYLSCSI